MWKILAETSWLGKKYLLISSPLLLSKFYQSLHTFFIAQVSLMFLQQPLQWQLSAPKSGLQNVVLFGFRSLHILKFSVIDNRYLFYYFTLLTWVVYIQFRYIACIVFVLNEKEFDPEIDWIVVRAFKCWYAVKYCKHKPVVFHFCTCVTSGLIYRPNLYTVASFICVVGHFWTAFLLSLINRISAACIVCI